MLISEKQQEANRQNAEHSTGPKTPEGKDAVRFNALTYGLRTRSTILPREDPEAYGKLWNELEADWQPQNRTEWCYLETLVTSQWLLARVADSESRIYQLVDFGEQQFRMLAFVAKQRAQLERSFRTAIDDLKKSKKERTAERTERPQPPTQPEKTPAGPPTQSPVPSPEYVMSEAVEAHPVLCSPATPDSR